MDLPPASRALTLGRAMLVTRGAIAFVVGVVTSNQPGISASTLVLILGVWALLEGATTIRQGYLRWGTPPRVDVQPIVVVLGGVALAAAAIVVVVPGLSTTTLTWVLAAWLAVRAGFELLGAYTATAKARLAMGAAVLVDIGLVAILVTHATGSVTNLALFGGALASMWGCLYFVLGALAKPVRAVVVPGPRLLSGR
jgi:hypothetical protein